MTLVYVLLIAAALAVGIAVGYVIRRSFAGGKAAAAEREAEGLVRDAKREAEALKKEARLEAKEEAHKVRSEGEAELRDRRDEISKVEQRLLQREEQLDTRAIEQDRREQTLSDREGACTQAAEDVKAAHEEAVARLESISGLSRAEARELILTRTEEEARHDMAKLVRHVEEEARREADRRARNILSLSIQRTAADHVAETTVSVVHLPSDDMKGRIIGREGRNIRTLENTTGIDFIIDDTPEAVVLSGFDGVRRETARLTLTKLIADGRIHPARIEEMHEQAKAEVEAAMEEAGEQACFDTNVHGLAPEIVKVLGRLKYRTSYGQNVLNHSIEVAHLAGLMAAELGANVKIAKRAGLLHDVGKAVDHEVDGSHAVISQQLAKRYRESRERAARHPGSSPATSSRRPSRPCSCRRRMRSPQPARGRAASRSRTTSSGSSRWSASQRARRASSGASPCRLGVRSGSWSSPPRSTMTPRLLLAREIAKEIEDQLDYPGQIRVTVIRESRAVDIAK